MPSTILAQVAGLPQLQDWIAPSVFVVIGLALAAAAANQRGWWVSGREHKASLAAQAAQYESRLAEKDRQLAYIETRREEERTSRLADAKSFGQVAAQLQTASDDLREVESMFGDEQRSNADQQYGQRLGTRRRGQAAASRDSARRQRVDSGE